MTSPMVKRIGVGICVAIVMFSGWSLWREMGPEKAMVVGTVGILPPILCAVLVLVTPRGNTAFEETRWVFTLSVTMTMVLGWPGVVDTGNGHQWIRAAATSTGLCTLIISFA